MAVFEPRDYQAEAIRRIIEHPYCGLFLDVGMGKTVSTLTAIWELMYDRFEIRRVLVVAPKRVARDVWTDERDKWDHLHGLRISVAVGEHEDRERALAADADLYTINIENVPWLVERYTPKTWPFDMVVLDELSGFKCPTGVRFRSMRKARPIIRRVVGLTGTPMSTGYIDLWGQVYLLDRGERLFDTVTRYRQTYFTRGFHEGHPVSNFRPTAYGKEQIPLRISDICFSMTADDHLKLPEKMYNDVAIKLEPREREQYDRFERDYIMSFGDADVTAASALALSGKLQQLANGAVYDEDGKVQVFHDQKLDALEEIIEESAGKPVMAVYWFKHDLERIRARFPKVRTLDDRKSMDDWNAGRIPLLALHPASAGHGLNLQFGGSTMVWFSLTWSLEKYEQTIGRLRRPGQKDGRIMIHRLIVRGTVDEDMLAALSSRGGEQSAFMRAIRARVRRVRGATPLPDRG